MSDVHGQRNHDLVAAVFGLQRAGGIIFLENQTVDWDKPKFVPHVVDRRHGTIHVPIVDFKGDKKPGFVALISQEHETVVAFVNDGKGNFRKDTLYTAPHPAYGSSGIQLVDLNGDGQLDVLYTNGDSLDHPTLLKPYDGVQWLENRGSFPFVHHHIAPQYGVMRAMAVDVDGDGMMDIVSVAFLPPEHFPTAREKGAEGVQIFRQVAPGQFERHVLEAGTGSHLTCTAGDVFGDGKVHVVAGNYFMSPKHAQGELVTVWRNLGRR